MFWLSPEFGYSKPGLPSLFAQTPALEEHVSQRLLVRVRLAVSAAVLGDKIGKMCTTQVKRITLVNMHALSAHIWRHAPYGDLQPHLICTAGAVVQIKSDLIHKFRNV